MLSKEPIPVQKGIVPPAGSGKRRPKVRAADATLNTLERLLVFQNVNRVWRPHLSITERDLLFYLLDRTVSWGNDTCRMTVNQMVEGTDYMPSVGQSRATIVRTLKLLRERGFLTQSSNGRATTFVLNLNWQPPLEHDMSISVPKTLKSSPEDMFCKPECADEFAQLLDEENSENVIGEVSDCDTRSVRMIHQDAHSEPPYNSILKTVENNLTPNPLPVAGGEGQGSLPGMNYRVSTRPTAGHAIAAFKAQPKGKVARPFWTVWQDAWTAAFPNVPCIAWSKVDNAMIHRVAARAKKTKLDPVAFIEFCVLHWREIIVREFSWMKQSPPPTYPRVGFLATDKFLEKFIDRYASSLTQKRLAFGLTDETTIERLRQTGMSYEDALIEIGKRKGVAEQRKEFEDRGRELARQAAANERGQKALMQAPRAPAKPHPRPLGPMENAYDDPNYQPPDFSDMKWDE